MPAATATRSWLDVLFTPHSIAIVGASDDPIKLSGRPVDNLLRFGYPGRIYPINHRRAQVQGLPAYPSLAAIGESVELAFLFVAAGEAAAAVRECGRLGVAVAIVAAAGFAETGDVGGRLQRELTLAAAESGVRVLGPNCLGVMGTAARCAATFTSALDTGDRLATGTTALVSQSGAFGTFIYSAARLAGVHLSHFASTGNEVDLDVVEILDGLVDQPEATVLLGYLEGLRDGRRLLELGRRALAADKPLIVTKVGRTDAGVRAASSHTASLAGADAVFDDVCRQAGIHRVEGINEIVDLAAVFDHGRRAAGNRLSILTLSGGAAALMTDVASANGVVVAEWQPAWQQRVAGVIPTFGSAANPIDLTAELIRDPEILAGALAVAIDHPGTDVIAVLVGNAARGADRLVSIIAAATRTTDKPVVVVWSGDNAAPLEQLAELGIPRYDDPGRAARAIAALTRHADARRQHGRSPVPPALDLPSATQALLRTARRAGRAQLDELEAGQVLAALGVPVAPALPVADPDEAWSAAQQLGLPVVVKLVSAQVAHKSELGGVAVGLASEAEVRAAWTGMHRRVTELGLPDGRVMVQEMAGGDTEPDGDTALELVVGAHRDPSFGLVVTAGLGGVLVEVLDDAVSLVPPIDAATAQAGLLGLRGARLLRGFRDRRPRDVAAAAELVAAFSRAIETLDGEVDEVELNPVLLGPQGSGEAVGVDALIVLRRAGAE